MNRRGFSIVEMLIMIVLVFIIITVGYNIFTNSYFYVRTAGEKLQNIHAVSVLMEGLRYELSSLPDQEQIDISDKPKDQWLTEFSYNKTLWTDTGRSNKPSVIHYKYDKSAREIIRTIDGKSQKFGRGRIQDFGIKHNYDPAVQGNPDKFRPVYFTIKISALADDTNARSHEAVNVQYTIYPRLFNKNLQLKNELKD